MTELEKSFDLYLDKNLKKNQNYIRKKYKRGCAKLFHYNPVFHNYAGRKILGREETNEVIKELIRSKRPFVVSRFGNTELNNLALYHMEHFENDFTKKKVWNSIDSKVDNFENCKCVFLEALENGCGFFPINEENISKFVKIMMDAIPNVDVLGTWDINMEEFYIENYMQNTILSDLYYLEPWFSKNPWSAELKEKKVLVVHPFEDTIISQYKHRKTIFKNQDVLPEFELHTLKAVQTIAGNRDERFSDWFEALEYMFNEAMKIDFDIAILGCGAYGMPLAVKLKNAGKQAIHLGGATQLLFGIKGARWEANNYPTKIAKYFNDTWVRPGQSESVKGKNTVENGCYW